MELCNSVCKYHLKVLRSLIDAAGRDDLRTVEALCIRMTGSRAAGDMLLHLLRWWPNAANRDGWVYKSYQDWWAELSIRQNDLPKANGALELVGVVIQTKKANGAPTKHYRLDLEKFWAAVGHALGIPENAFATHLGNAFTSIQQMDFVNGHKSITTTPTTNSDNTAVLLDLAFKTARKVSGVSEYSARQWIAQYGAERVLAVANMVLTGHWKNPAAVCASALRERWECKPVEVEQIIAAERNEQAKFADDIASQLPPGIPPVIFPDDDETKPDDFKPHPLPDLSEDETEEEDTDRTPAVDIPTRQRDAWNSTYSQLEVQLDRASFDTYLRGAWLSKAEDWRLTVAVTNAYARDMLQYRLYRDIRRVLCDTAGHQEADIVFEVQKLRKQPEGKLPLFKRLAMQSGKVA